jgi:lactoylglutathione lyase
MNGSVFKLNDVRDPMPEAAPAGYRELVIARAGLAAPRRLVDPEGNVVTLVPPGHDGVTGIGVRIAASDAAAFDDFYARICGFERMDKGRYRCGDTLLLVHEDRNAGRESELRGRGYRYLTVQVRECDTEHRGVLARGATEGRPPITLGTTARFSFIRDPGGNWIEISQRASLTGPLPA